MISGAKVEDGKSAKVQMSRDPIALEMTHANIGLPIADS